MSEMELSFPWLGDACSECNTEMHLLHQDLQLEYYMKLHQKM